MGYCAGHARGGVRGAEGVGVVEGARRSLERFWRDLVVSAVDVARGCLTLPILTVTPRSTPTRSLRVPGRKTRERALRPRGDLRDGASRRRRGLRVRRPGRRLHLPGPAPPEDAARPERAVSPTFSNPPRAFHPSPAFYPRRAPASRYRICPAADARMGLSRALRRRGSALRPGHLERNLAIVVGIVGGARS